MTAGVRPTVDEGSRRGEAVAGESRRRIPGEVEDRVKRKRALTSATEGAEGEATNFRTPRSRRMSAVGRSPRATNVLTPQARIPAG